MLVLAPMAGITDHTFRLLCREMGADYTVSEMISAKALCYRDLKTATLAQIRKDEGPTALQIFGSEPQIMAEAAGMLEENSYTGCISEVKPIAIDINMGCPMRKITGNGEGSALMKNPERIYDIVRAVSSAIKLPVTVKIRTGWDSEHVNAVECALAAEEGGATAIAVHGRTREQLYRPPVDRGTIAAVKKSVGIPVIANGGIASGIDARKMLAETGCDGLMIGQAAEGNPWIFAEISAALKGLPYTPPTAEERLTMGERHVRLLTADKGERTGVREARRPLAHYSHGMKGAAAFRLAVNQAESAAELLTLIENLRAHLNDEPQDNELSRRRNI